MIQVTPKRISLTHLPNMKVWIVKRVSDVTYDGKTREVETALFVSGDQGAAEAKAAFYREKESLP